MPRQTGPPDEVGLMPAQTSVHRLTQADLDDMPDDGNRYELLDGVLLVTPAPIRPHQRVLIVLLRAIEDADHLTLPAPVDLPFAEDTVLQPDLCVWLAGGKDPFYDDPDRPPDLVVEVSSPSTRRRDLTIKRDRYAAEGLHEYWFVDLEAGEVVLHVLDGATYDASRHDEVLVSPLLGLTIDVTTLFGP